MRKHNIERTGFCNHGIEKDRACYWCRKQFLKIKAAEDLQRKMKRLSELTSEIFSLMPEVVASLEHYGKDHSLVGDIRKRMAEFESLKELINGPKDGLPTRIQEMPK